MGCFWPANHYTGAKQTRAKLKHCYLPAEMADWAANPQPSEQAQTRSTEPPSTISDE